MDQVFVVFAAIFVLVVLASGARAVVRWRGPRRVLAVLTLIGAIGWGAIIAIGVSRDPNSHNLWPLEAVMVAGATLTALVTIGMTRSSKPVVRGS